MDILLFIIAIIILIIIFWLLLASKTVKEIDLDDHFLGQVIRFGRMLNGIDPDRSEKILHAQLGYNLGQYVKGNNLDGRKIWQLYESCINAERYNEIVKFAQRKYSISD